VSDSKLVCCIIKYREDALTQRMILKCRHKIYNLYFKSK